MVVHLLHTENASGSSPLITTNFILELSGAVYTLANVSNVLCDEHLKGQVLLKC